MKGKKPFTGYVGLEIEIIVKPPESWSKKKKAWAMEGRMFPIHCDIDNQIKGVCDGMNRAVWNDDRQVNYLTVRREYGPEEKVLVTVSGLRV